VPRDNGRPREWILPDYGKIQTYVRGGFGIRLDGASAYRRGGITPYYDSLLVKVTAWGPNSASLPPQWNAACASSAYAGVKTNIPFLTNVVNHEQFQAGGLHIHPITRPSR